MLTYGLGPQCGRHWNTWMWLLPVAAWAPSWHGGCSKSEHSKESHAGSPFVAQRGSRRVTSAGITVVLGFEC